MTEVATKTEERQEEAPIKPFEVTWKDIPIRVKYFVETKGAASDNPKVFLLPESPLTLDQMIQIAGPDWVTKKLGTNFKKAFRAIFEGSLSLDEKENVQDALPRFSEKAYRSELTSYSFTTETIKELLDKQRVIITELTSLDVSTEDGMKRWDEIRAELKRVNVAIKERQRPRNEADDED